MKLNHDVLKQTDGLLAGIDEILRQPSIAAAVERVLASAAPEIGYDIYDSVEAWHAYDDEWLDASNEDLWHQRHANECQCEYIYFTEERIYEDGRSYTSQAPWRECDLDHLGRPVHDLYGKIDPFQDDYGLNVALGHAGGRSADIPCGAEGCPCEDLFDPVQLCDFCEAPVRLNVQSGEWVTARGGNYCPQGNEEDWPAHRHTSPEDL